MVVLEGWKFISDFTTTFLKLRGGAERVNKTGGKRKQKIKIEILTSVFISFLDSIVVSILACHARDPGSIPGRGAFYFSFF